MEKTRQTERERKKKNNDVINTPVRRQGEEEEDEEGKDQRKKVRRNSRKRNQRKRLKQFFSSLPPLNPSLSPFFLPSFTQAKEEKESASGCQGTQITFNAANFYPG